MSRIFGDVIQNGYVVRDIEAAMRHWIEVLGVGPWFYIERLPAPDFVYRGVPSAPHVTIALANSGALQIELIQQRNDAPSMYMDFLRDGHEGLHHLGYGCRDYERDVAAYLAQGYEVGQAATVPGRGAFTYLMTEAHPGTVVELFDMDHGRREVYAAIEACARDWDGSDPIRTTLPGP